MIFRSRTCFTTIGNRGRQVIRETFQKLGERNVAGRNAAPEALGPVTQILKYSGEPRTIATLDVGALVQQAAASGALIVMACAVGDTLVEETVICGFTARRSRSTRRGS
jgi:uncharacterized membrane protein